MSRPIGKRISMKEAMEMAAKAGHRAEAERIAYADEEAQRGIQYDESEEIDRLRTELEKTKVALAKRHECWANGWRAAIESSTRFAQLKAELETAKAKIVELCESIVRNSGHREVLGFRKDWYDSMALRDIVDAGEHLVGLGLWERHPDGVGRRQWYRPKEKK